jgi:tRNA(Ile)-lysidine synthase
MNFRGDKGRIASEMTADPRSTIKAVMADPDAVAVARFRADLERLGGGARAPVGVAVSGGPDSLALLLLANAAFPGLVHAATVDHGLRPESGGEAAMVAQVCAGLGVPHAILAAGMTATANIQAQARERRYALLAEWAARNGMACILTAHHLDDQAETLLMRLMRGSGLAGLAGIRAAQRSSVPILRPLLGWRRAELAAIVGEAGLDAADDPSNADERFDRARLRRHLAESEWIDPVPVARSAAALAEAEDALAWTAQRLWDERVAADGPGFSLDPTGLPAELRRRLVLAILAAIGGPAPRGEEVARLIAALEAGGTATLAGAKCGGGERWRFAPAPPRR